MLDIQQLTAGYGSHCVLNALSLQAFRGEVHGILGTNGAGKTTFFNAVYGFLPAWSGALMFDGRPLRRQDIAYLETEPFFYPYLRGREYLELLTNPGHADIAYWGRVFDLPLEVLVNEYSTGMRKKLGLAGVFMQNRPIWMLDEPFNGLDLESSEKLAWLLEQTKKQGERVVLLSSHILPTLTRLCDRISRLAGGGIAATYLPGAFDSLESELKASIGAELAGMVRGDGAVSMF